MTKTVAQHKRDGTYRKDRQGKRIEEQFKPGTPTNILKLDKTAQEVRALVISDSPDGMLSERDGVALDAMSMLFSEWVKAHKAADDYNSKCNALGLFKAYSGLSAKFGMTPLDRTKLRAEEGKQKADNNQFLDLLKQKAN